jgi:disulfide bond formation protein DsbB
MNALARARLLALVIPAALLVGALGSQYLGGLFPCEMCHWQRWPHYAALGAAALAFVPLARSTQRALVLLAALLILLSGLIGVFHAGVEYGWWEGLTRCSLSPGGSSDILADIMATPLVQCNQPQWTLFGISLAGWNALFSIGGAAAILALWTRRPR